MTEILHTSDSVWISELFELRDNFITSEETDIGKGNLIIVHQAIFGTMIEQRWSGIAISVFHFTVAGEDSACV